MAEQQACSTGESRHKSIRREKPVLDMSIYEEIDLDLVWKGNMER